MDPLPEFVGTVHIFLGPYRGNPIALYLRKGEADCHISPRIYPWNQTVGQGETPNKAAADFEAKWKETELSADMYSGPHWEGGIKPEKPKPPPKPAAPKPAAAPKAETKADDAEKVAPPKGEDKPPASAPAQDASASTPPAAPPEPAKAATNPATTATSTSAPPATSPQPQTTDSGSSDSQSQA